MFGNGLSSSPTIANKNQKGSKFPDITLWDNIYCQHKLVTEKLKIKKIALVTGWSMAGCQAYHWAARYPEMVAAILPFCASARTSPHNYVFLEGVKAALTADKTWENGNYRSPPIAGLKAFGRVYAGWAYSQTFFREGQYNSLGFDTIEALLHAWEEDHLQWDANNLLTKLWTWQNADISANPIYQGDFHRALGNIKARTILMPCSSDLYFPPEDNEIEVTHMPNAELRIYHSTLGHCVASPGNDPKFMRFLDRAISELLKTTNS